MIFILVVSFCLQGFPFFSEPPITASLNKNTVYTGENFVYTVTVKGAFQKPALYLPDFENLIVVSRSREYIPLGKKKELKTTIVVTLCSPDPQVVKISSSLLTDGKRRFKSKGLIVKIIGDALSKEKKLESYIQGGKIL